MPTTGQGTPRGRPCGRPTVRRPRRPYSDRAGSRDSCSNCPATVTTVATARRLLAVAHLQRPYYNYPPFKRDAYVPYTFFSCHQRAVGLGRLQNMTPTLIKTSPALCIARGPPLVRSGVKRVVDLAEPSP